MQQKKSYSYNLNSISVENDRNSRAATEENNKKVDFFIRKVGSQNANKPGVIPDAKIPLT